MFNHQKKGYRVERKIRIFLEKAGWKVIRPGASLGEADLICLKNGECFLLQVKSTKKDALYYYGYMEDRIEGFPFFLVVDFGYGKIRVTKPMKKVSHNDGVAMEDFLTNVIRW
jgi:Holliday junction resolvase